MKKSTKNQIKAEFFEFLRENDCASKFCVNFYNKKGRDYRYMRENPTEIISKLKDSTTQCDPLAEYINEEPSKNWVLNAFGWSETIQGHDYWSEIHYKWIKSINLLILLQKTLYTPRRNRIQHSKVKR